LKNKKRKLYQEKQLQKKTRSLLIFTIVAIILVAVVATLINKMSQDEKALPTQVTASSYSLTEMQNFWSDNFSQTVDSLFTGKYPLPKVQQRFNEVTKHIRERYGYTNIIIHLNDGYEPENALILAGSSLTDGDKPTLEITVPSLIDIYKREQRKGDPDANERVRYVLVLSIMHELDHLAFDTMKGTREHPPSLDQLVDSERKIWALTCEYSIRPMIEDYHITLTTSEYVYYNKWVEIGRNADSPAWVAFIRNLYKDTRGE
jgi:hypothetical protein